MTFSEIVGGIFGLLFIFVGFSFAFGIVSDLWYGVSGAGHRDTFKELRALREESRAAREAPTGRPDAEEIPAPGLDPFLSPNRLPQ